MSNQRNRKYKEHTDIYANKTHKLTIYIMELKKRKHHVARIKHHENHSYRIWYIYIYISFEFCPHRSAVCERRTVSPSSSSVVLGEAWVQGTATISCRALVANRVATVSLFLTSPRIFSMPCASMFGCGSRSGCPSQPGGWTSRTKRGIFSFDPQSFVQFLT